MHTHSLLVRKSWRTNMYYVFPRLGRGVCMHPAAAGLTIDIDRYEPGPVKAQNKRTVSNTICIHIHIPPTTSLSPVQQQSICDIQLTATALFVASVQKKGALDFWLLRGARSCYYQTWYWVNRYGFIASVPVRMREEDCLEKSCSFSSSPLDMFDLWKRRPVQTFSCDPVVLVDLIS